MRKIEHQCNQVQFKGNYYSLSSFTSFYDDKSRAEVKAFCQVLSYELEMLNVPKSNVCDIVLMLYSFISQGIAIPNMVECGNNTLFVFFKDEPKHNTTGIKLSIKIQQPNIIIFFERSDEYSESESESANERMIIS